MYIFRYIIFHADSSLVPVMRTQKPDSHAKVNPIKLVQLMEDFAKLLKTPSIIIVEDVPFFNVQIKTNPTIDWTKPKIQEWLENHDIPFDQDMLKWQLLDIASK